MARLIQIGGHGRFSAVPPDLRFDDSSTDRALQALEAHLKTVPQPVVVLWHRHADVGLNELFKLDQNSRLPAGVILFSGISYAGADVETSEGAANHVYNARLQPSQVHLLAEPVYNILDAQYAELNRRVQRFAKGLVSLSAGSPVPFSILTAIRRPDHAIAAFVALTAVALHTWNYDLVNAAINWGDVRKEIADYNLPSLPVEISARAFQGWRVQLMEVLTRNSSWLPMSKSCFDWKSFVEHDRRKINDMLRAAPLMIHSLIENLSHARNLARRLAIQPNGAAARGWETVARGLSFSPDAVDDRAIEGAADAIRVLTAEQHHSCLFCKHERWALDTAANFLKLTDQLAHIPDDQWSTVEIDQLRRAILETPTEAPP